MIASIRAAVVPFVVSRAAVLLLIATFSSMQTVKSSFGIVRETRIDLGKFSNGVFVNADAEWFRSIAQDGYARERFQNGAQRNWAFFPAFPLAVRWLHLVPSYALNALLLTQLFFFAGLAMLHALAIAAGMPAEVAQRALVYAAFFPTSYFFSLPVFESLFLLLGAALMIRNLVRSVIHDAHVTRVGGPSLPIDPVILRTAQILPFEQVEIFHAETGGHSRTWAEATSEGSGAVEVPGGARTGDLVTIVCYAQLHDGQTLDHQARVVHLDSRNQAVSVA